MAKYRHRIFEMYDFREESILAMTPKVEKPATEVITAELGTYKHLSVSRSAAVTLVRFKEPSAFGEETVRGLRDDLSQLRDRLERDSKVVLDFTSVVSFGSDSIDALVQFNKQLKTKGNRLALCALSPAVRECFFVASVHP